MNDKALQNAEAKQKQLLDRRLELHSEITAIDDEIGKIKDFILKWHMFADSENDSVDETEQNKNAKSDSRPSVKRATGNSPKDEVAAAARELILERGLPIMRNELYELLTARGLTINGKNPQMVLSTMLWRMKDTIVRVEGGGYWPADVRNDDLGYDPETARPIDSLLQSTPDDILDPDSEEYKDALKRTDGSAFD